MLVLVLILPLFTAWRVGSNVEIDRSGSFRCCMFFRLLAMHERCQTITPVASESSSCCSSCRADPIKSKWLITLCNACQCTVMFPVAQAGTRHGHVAGELVLRFLSCSSAFLRNL